MLANYWKRRKTVQRKKFADFLAKNFPAYAKTTLPSEKIKFAIQYILESEKKTFEQLPWQNQFLPIILKNPFKVKHFKNVNPGMSHFSGMVEIPKSEIQKNLPKKYLPQSVLCLQEDSFSEVLKKKSAQKIEYPIICKPNTGERSNGVQYIINDQELKTYIGKKSADFLLQEFLDYKHEYGLAVERKDRKNFRITSLAQKNTPVITGNGTSTIQELVQKLPLTSPEKNKILANTAATEKKSIPKKGQTISIVRTASISLGTKIIDCRKYITPEMEKSISLVLQKYKGFHVGRFDIKANSISDIAKGKFKIIELNGINGIPMHIYDGKFTLDQKYDELEQYFHRLLKRAERNQKKHHLKPASMLSTLFFFGRAVKRQPVSKKLKQEKKKHYRTIRKFLFWAEFYRFQEKIRGFFS